MGMTYLIDTHVLIWLTSYSKNLPASLRRRLSACDSTLLVSSATTMEVATKVRIGKLPQAAALMKDGAWEEALHRLRAQDLPVTTKHALLAGSLDWDHKDPFDRLLAAQALSEKVPLVTVDAQFDSLAGLTIIWDDPVAGAHSGDDGDAHERQ